MNLNIPLCLNKKCRRRHEGKCLLDRDLEAEQRSLDFAGKIKGGMQGDASAGAEGRVMRKANAVSFEDLNEHRVSPQASQLVGQS